MGDYGKAEPEAPKPDHIVVTPPKAPALDSFD